MCGNGLEICRKLDAVRAAGFPEDSLSRTSFSDPGNNTFSSVALRPASEPLPGCIIQYATTTRPNTAAANVRKDPTHAAVSDGGELGFPFGDGENGGSGECVAPAVDEGENNAVERRRDNRVDVSASPTQPDSSTDPDVGIDSRIVNCRGSLDIYTPYVPGARGGGGEGEGDAKTGDDGGNGAGGPLTDIPVCDLVSTDGLNVNTGGDKDDVTRKETEKVSTARPAGMVDAFKRVLVFVNEQVEGASNTSVLPYRTRRVHVLCMKIGGRDWAAVTRGVVCRA